jgi:hypothetical protein
MAELSYLMIMPCVSPGSAIASLFVFIDFADFFRQGRAPVKFTSREAHEQKARDVETQYFLCPLKSVTTLAIVLGRSTICCVINDYGNLRTREAARLQTRNRKMPEGICACPFYFALRDTRF